MKKLLYLTPYALVCVFGLIFFLIYKYSDIFFPIFGVFVLILIIWGAIDSHGEDKENEKEKQRKNTEYVKKILNDSKRYEKNPSLQYREIIKGEKYRKIFDEKIKDRKYQKILKDLKHGKYNSELNDLAISIRALEPDVIKRAKELVKQNHPEIYSD